MYATFIVTNIPSPGQKPTAISTAWNDAQNLRTQPTNNASLKPQTVNSDLESWNSLNGTIHQTSTTLFGNRIATDNSTITISSSQASYSSYLNLLNYFDNK